MLHLLAALAMLLTILAGCGGSDGEVSQTTTTRSPETTTTTALSPDAAFDQALSDQLDGIDAAFIAGSRSAGRTLCDNLTRLSAEPDDATAALTPTLLVTAVFEGYSQPAVAAVVLRATAQHICPEHAEAIEGLLTTKGQ